jgi:hypothetical protein
VDLSGFGRIRAPAATIALYTNLPVLLSGSQLQERQDGRSLTGSIHGGQRIVTFFFELAILIATIAGLILGGLCIYWVKVEPGAGRARWGARLFIVALLSLGAAGLVGAIVRAGGLAPLGLLSGMLIIGMLWESPAPTPHEES